nr:MAG TPA: hypothetical protein [Caudoviricetes sp.]
MHKAVCDAGTTQHTRVRHEACPRFSVIRACKHKLSMRQRRRKNGGLV